MRHLRVSYLLFILVLFINCKNGNEIKDISTFDKPKKEKLSNLKLKVLKDTIISGIDSSKLGISITDKSKLLKLFFKSFEKDFIKSIVNFDKIKDSQDNIEIRKYSEINLNGVSYNTYLFSFYYENDAIYRSLLLVNKFLNDGLMIYEKVVNEGEYLRISKINKDIIINTLYEINYYKYDKEGNILERKKKKDSLIILTNKFLVKENIILDYFEETNKMIDKEWGDKEVFYTKDGLDSSYVYQFKQKGKIKNHLKEGDWEERKFLQEYDKSVWMNGKYPDGKKIGEWYYSPNGPAEKVEIFDNGILVKSNKI